MNDVIGQVSPSIRLSLDRKFGHLIKQMEAGNRERFLKDLDEAYQKEHPISSPLFELQFLHRGQDSQSPGNYPQEGQAEEQAIQGA